MFSPDVMRILEAGASLIVGTVGTDGVPRATRAFAFTVVDDGARIARIVMSADDELAVEHLASGTGVVALTAADVRSLRSVQVKGRITRTEASTAADLEALTEHSEAFFRAVTATDGHPDTVMRRLLPLRTIAVEFEVQQLFDQTPGPTAGRPVDMVSR